MKNYQIECKVEYTFGGKNKLEETRVAELDVSKDFTGESAIRFEEDYKRIVKLIKKAAKNGGFVDLQLTVSTYKDSENVSEIQSTGFKAWKGIGYSDAESEGFHLEPDTRYVPETQDLFLSFEETAFEFIRNL